MSRPPLTALGALAVLAIIVVAACSSAAAPGWTYAPAPSVTPPPPASGSAEPSGSAPASAAPTPSGVASPGTSASPSGTADELTVTAADGAATAGFDPDELEAAADTPFSVIFDNQDTTTSPHNWVLKDASGQNVDIGDTAFFSGPEQREYAVPALAAGDYPFVCEVHAATMTGTLHVE